MNAIHGFPAELGLGRFNDSHRSKPLTVLEKSLYKNMRRGGNDRLDAVRAKAEEIQNSRNSELLEAALGYAERGWPVLQIAQGKKVGEGEATTYAARIREMWSEKPEENIGIDLKASGLCVLEVEADVFEKIDGVLYVREGKGEGVKSLAGLGLPVESLKTLRADTGLGSEQLFFRVPKNVSLQTGKIAPGLTLYAGGSFAVPPSTLGKTISIWLNATPIAPLPLFKIVEPLAAWPEPLDLAALSKHAPEQPRFIMDDWLPCGYATLFAGHGGVGKSGIALHLAVCIAAGVPFFGVPVARRRVLYMSCEDRENVLHWRLSRICAFLGIDLAKLAGWLGLLDLVGKPTILWDKDPRTGDSYTAAYSNLENLIQANKAQVLFVDGVADAFGGNENSRTEVKAFVNSLLALVPPDDGAVLLVGHISKLTASNATTSEGYSGSTGWHNSVRARWYLRSDANNELTLELQKSNLGPTDHAMNFRWDTERHLLVGKAATQLDTALRDREEQEGILAAMRACRTPVPAASTGKGTTFNTLVAVPEFPRTLDNAGGRKRFWKHIAALLQMGAIAEGTTKTPSRHTKAVYVVTGEGWDEKF